MRLQLCTLGVLPALLGLLGQALECGLLDVGDGEVTAVKLARTRGLLVHKAAGQHRAPGPVRGADRWSHGHGTCPRASQLRGCDGTSARCSGVHADGVTSAEQPGLGWARHPRGPARGSRRSLRARPGLRGGDGVRIQELLGTTAPLHAQG